MEKFNIRDAVQFLKPYIQPYRRHFIAFYAGWLLDTVIAVFIPILLGIMLDEMIYRQNLTDFLKVSGVVIGLSIYSCVLYYWLYAQHHYLMIMFTFQIKIAVFEKFMRIQPLKLKFLRIGEIISVIQEYPAECMHFLIRGIIHQINNFIIIAVLLIFSFRINVALGILMLTLSGICGGVTIIFGKKSKKVSIIQRKEYGGYIGWLYEMIENYIPIRLLSAQRTVEEKYDSYSKNLFREKNRIYLLEACSDQIIKGIFLVCELCVFGAAAYLIKENLLTIGVFTVVIAYFNRLINVLIDINQKWSDAQARAGYIQKISEYMDYPDEEDTGKLIMRQCRGEIQIDNLNFSYDSKKIYDDFCLHIRPGEKIAVVGPSGSGKSTLAELLTGMLKPDAGEIKIDGVNIKELSLKSLRQKVGILFQDSVLLKDMREDIDFWEEDTLSGGERQQAAMEDLIKRDPDIVILDEPTSSLDTATEWKIIESWKKVFRDKTMIIITHRSGPLELCDRVIQIGDAV